MKNFLLFIMLIGLLSCKGQDCETLPKTYTSYSVALATLKKASFNYVDSINTSSSSWITGADFYSCDGAEGFLILKTSKKSYIFKNVSISVWSNFKNADSYGKFYNKYLKDKFQLAI